MDRNTKYFQAMVRKRRVVKRIVQLKGEDGEWYDGSSQMEHCSISKEFMGNRRARNSVRFCDSLKASIYQHSLKIEKQR